MKRFNDLSDSIAKELKVSDAILDGEIVALDSAGKPDFYNLMKRQCQAVYYAFDIVCLNGRDLRDLPLVERKKILRTVIPRKSSWIGCVSYVDRGALKLFELVPKTVTRRSARSCRTRLSSALTLSDQKAAVLLVTPNKSWNETGVVAAALGPDLS